MSNWAMALFTLVFTCQILLTSGYFARRMERRLQRVFEDYSPDQYPKLYPRPRDDYRTMLGYFRLANRALLLLGFVLLFVVVFVIDHATFADDGQISELIPGLYGFIQFLPFMALEFTECSQLRLMRRAGIVTKRRASLERRGLFALVSPLLLAAALVCLAASILVDFYVHGFVVSLGHDTVQRAIVLVATNLLLVGVGAFTLYGGKRDPYQAGADHLRKLRTNLRSLAYVSIVLSLFIGLRAAGNTLPMDAIEATLMSVYFQVIVLLSLGYVLNSLRIEDMNFEVYRDDVAARPT